MAKLVPPTPFQAPRCRYVALVTPDESFTNFHNVGLTTPGFDLPVQALAVSTTTYYATYTVRR
jgi:hypothetical protein